ncbi:trehalose-phosphatase [Novosphingobium sp. G106]|uniref:trehalose-phosphatase n=1 Tax=Novosphingobium sp. G106 TaxID=2849500 RepID=UPI001C2D0D1F|nr:trehalose-phosphatase [Novosphingobium sp. G106]MBV1691369.1 trehalose-phosphatase [Novosphingobium sp. G106]
MQQPRPPIFPSQSISLFLDFDGTLIDLADRPDAVVVAEPLVALIDGLIGRLAGRVAVVSGRSIEQLDSLIGSLHRRLATVGSHGAEVRLAGASVCRLERPHALDDAERAFREDLGQCEGIVIEVKSLGVAIHYRQNPSLADAAHAAVQRFGAVDGLVTQEGKMMVELRSSGHDKGSAIAALMQAPPFAGSLPVFLGDDVTDEAGFERCVALGGTGILVGAPRKSAAQYRLASVADVHDWLRAL